MKNSHSTTRRSTASRWQASFNNFANLNRLVPERVLNDDPPLEDQDEDLYAFMLRRRERWLGR